MDNSVPFASDYVLVRGLVTKLHTPGRIFANNVFLKEGYFLSKTPLVGLKLSFAPPNGARLKIPTLAISRK